MLKKLWKDLRYFNDPMMYISVGAAVLGLFVLVFAVVYVMFF